MNHRLCFVIACWLAAGLSAEVAGQTYDRQMRERVDSVLAARYVRTPYDTNYVVRPGILKSGNGDAGDGAYGFKGVTLKGLTLKVRFNQTGNSIHAKGTVNDIYSKADLRTNFKTTFAIAAIYRGIGVGLAINPAKWKSAYKDYELNLNFYSSRLSLDASYQRSESLAGDINGDRGAQHMNAGDVSMKVLNLAGYYTFNHRRFSYPAAFTQSYIQRRSAGSWLAGISYQGGSIETTEQLKERSENAPNVRIYLGHVGIGGGYGYNWVLGRKWLLHFSILPTFVVFNRNNMTVNGERKKAQHMRFNMLFNERAAVVYNFSPRHFAGLTLVMNNSIFDDEAVVVNQNKWRLRAFVGVRL